MRALLIVLVLLVAHPVQAADLLGADTVDTDERAPFVLAGLPDATFGVRYGVNSALDVAPRLRLAWAMATRVGGFGVGVGAEVRLRALRWQAWSVSLQLRPELLVHSQARDLPSVGPGTSSVVALDTGLLGVVAGREIAPDTRVHVGVRVHPQLFASPQAAIAWPMLLELGGEALIGGRWRALVQSELGAVVYGAGGRRDSELSAAIRVGLGWL